METVTNQSSALPAAHSRNELLCKLLLSSGIETPLDSGEGEHSEQDFSGLTPSSTSNQNIVTLLEEIAARLNVLPESTAYPPLDQVTRPTVPTDHAAYLLGRKPQTLRAWASQENGPLRPIRVNGRLAWPIAEIKKILGVQ